MGKQGIKALGSPQVHAKAGTRKLPPTATESRGQNENREGIMNALQRGLQTTTSNKFSGNRSPSTETDATAANCFLGTKKPTPEADLHTKVSQIIYICVEGVLALLLLVFQFLQQMCRSTLTCSIYGCMLSLHCLKEDSSCPALSSHLLFMPNSSVNIMVHTLNHLAPT